VGNPKPRRDRVALNDERILDATVTVLDQFGIDGLAARRVADQAGLSTGAVYGRFENTDELLLEVWNRRLRAVVRAGLERSGSLADPELDDPDPDVPVSYDPVLERLGAFVIALAPRNDVLAEVIIPEVDTWLVGMGIGPGHPADRRAARAIAVGTYFGAMLYGSVSDALHPDWGMCLNWWEQARHRGVGVVDELSAEVAPAGVAVESGDPNLDALLLATGVVMARSGVAGTTITRIARRAGVPRTAVYAYYDSKDDLVQACVFQAMASASVSNRRMKAITTPHGVAALARRITDPSSRTWRRRRVEGLLAAPTSPAIASAILQAEIESENDLIMRFGLVDSASEHALRQLVRFLGVVASGLAVVPELSSVFDGIDWRLALSPIVGVATDEIFGEQRSAQPERS